MEQINTISRERQKTHRAAHVILITWSVLVLFPPLGYDCQFV